MYRELINIVLYRCKDECPDIWKMFLSALDFGKNVYSIWMIYWKTNLLDYGAINLLLGNNILIVYYIIERIISWMLYCEKQCCRSEHFLTGSDVRNHSEHADPSLAHP